MITFPNAVFHMEVENTGDYEGKEVRKYVVRQQVLPDDKLVLTIVYR